MCKLYNIIYCLLQLNPSNKSKGEKAIDKVLSKFQKMQENAEAKFREWEEEQ